MTRAIPYYAAVQVGFFPILEMETYAAKLQESLRRNGYPRVHPQVVTRIRVQVEIDQATTPQLENSTVWHFVADDQRSGFILSHENLVFHTTTNLDEKDIFDRFYNTLEELFRLTQSTAITQAGVRSLRVLCSDAGEPVEDRVATGIRGLGISGKEPVIRVFESVFEEPIVGSTSNSTLQMRAIRSAGPIGYPANFRPQGLEDSEVIRRGESLKHVSFDVMHTAPFVPPLNYQNLEPTFSALQQRAREAFEAAQAPELTEKC